MRLKNKKTGEIGYFCFANWNDPVLIIMDKDGVQLAKYTSLVELNEEWEDVPKEPKKYKYVLPNKVRRAILSWVRVQDNPIEKISILRMPYVDTKEVDADGFYDYHFYGYVGDNNKNLVANTLTIRLKKPFKFDENKDYTLPELGIMGEFGGEE